MAPDASAIGIDLGGTKILARTLDPSDLTQVLAEERVDTPRGAEAIVAAVAGLVAGLDRQLAGRGAPPIGAVGVGAAGLVDGDGVVRFAPNLPGVIDHPLRHRLAEACGLPVVVDNDATAATVAEHRLGAGVGATDLVLVTLGTGIGAGVVSGGRLQRGAHGFAGEAGHMLVDPAGPPCPCGRRGCWERYASGSGLGRLARDAAQAGRAGAVVARAGGDPDDVRGEHVSRAAQEGDPEALAVIESFAWWVAVGVANIVNLLDCDVVVLGGGLVDMGDLLMVPVRAAYQGIVVAADHRPPVAIVPARLGSDAGAIGAWLLARDLLVGTP